MVTRFRELPCPMCGVSGGLLNGAPLNQGSSELIVGCRSCLEQQLKSANKASVLALFLKPATALTAISRNDATLRELERRKADAGTPGIQSGSTAGNGRTCSNR